MTSTQSRGRGDSAASSEERAKSIFGMYDSFAPRVSEDEFRSNGRPISMLPYLNGHGAVGNERMERVEELVVPADMDEMFNATASGSGLQRTSSTTSSTRSRRSARVRNGKLSQYIPNGNTDQEGHMREVAVPLAPPLPNDLSGNPNQSTYTDRHNRHSDGDQLDLAPPNNHDTQSSPHPTHDETIRPSPMMDAAIATSHAPPSPAASVHPSVLPHAQAQAALQDDPHYRLDPDASPEEGQKEDGREREVTAADSFASGRTQRGVGEEDDAYHVRSTYARLEVQGVYGDGWTEGVERTRERAAMANRGRKSLVPGSREDPMMEEEMRVLSTVDRYGFFDQTLKTRSEHRLVLLSSTSFGKHPKFPSRPPKRAKTVLNEGNGLIPTNQQNDSNTSNSDIPNTTVPPEMLIKLSARAIGKFREKEDERVGKWERMLKVAEKDRGGNVMRWTWDADGKGAKLSERVYKGVPDRWRAAAWWAMMDGSMGKEGNRRRQVDLAQLLRSYEAAMDLPSTYDVQIDLDVPRTISGHVLFHTRYGYGQRSLFHVLHCFSMYCSTCGYCQGMGPIAATLLTYFDAGRTYATLVRLHDVYRMHSIFEPGFPGLLECFYVQERILEYLMPEVFTAFERNMISTSSYATKWYITLYANTVPYQTQLRIWDALLLEGPDLLVIVGIAIIWSLKESLAAPRADFEMLLSNLSAFYVPEDEDALMLWVSKVIAQKVVRTKMTGWREDWAKLVIDGQSGKALM